VAYHPRPVMVRNVGRQGKLGTSRSVSLPYADERPGASNRLRASRCFLQVVFVGDTAHLAVESVTMIPVLKCWLGIRRRFSLCRSKMALVIVVAVASMAAPAVGQESQRSGVQRYVRFQRQEQVGWALWVGNQLREMSSSPFDADQLTGRTFMLSEVRLLVPTVERPKVFAVAGNYRSHLADPSKVPAHPEIFLKLPTCLVPHEGLVLIPPGTSEVHFEGELVVIMKERAVNVEPADALRYVLGVTAGNDISARDWQKADIQWWRAKGSDTFGPIGPAVVSGLDYQNLDLQLRQNGVVRQKANTREMIHGVADIVSWISKHVTLEPGDVIFTGTPGTTQAIAPGDVLEVELEGVGILRNRVALAEQYRASAQMGSLSGVAGLQSFRLLQRVRPMAPTAQGP
jgi:2-keto-4-pentenoate hydratase/2-oxohepta-3-ene-1,7-dioic acid hydratase in catechol pathway